MTQPVPSTSEPRSATSETRPWTPRFWDGMTLGPWLRLIVRNRCRVHISCWLMLVVITLITAIQSLLAGIQWLLYSWRMRGVRIEQPPLFIIGHWRSGTTLLHELLVLDPRHTSPTTWECFAPNNFLVTGKFASRWLGFLLPKHRPMDNMPAGWDRPQEDEFALCNMGQPSPYLSIAFPNNPPLDDDYLTLENVPAAARERWKHALATFLRRVTFLRPRRIVLKSPPHTCRIATLAEMFPTAKFVHIVRDPRAVFPSTVNLWKSLAETQGLQRPRFDGLEERVFATFTRMYEAFERQRTLLSPDQFCEVRYEDLVREPSAQLRAIYEQLQLGDFEQVRGAVEQYLARTKDYKPNRFRHDPRIHAEIARRWRPFLDKYGYQTTEQTVGT